MSTAVAVQQANKDVVRKFYAAIESENYQLAASFCSEEFTFYFQLDTPIYGVEGFVDSEKKNFDAFEGFSFKVERLFAEDNQVAAYMIFDGKQSGVHDGVSARGARLRFSLMMLLTLREGKIMEKRAHFDRLDVRNQLTV